MSEDDIAFVEVDVGHTRERTYGIATCPADHLHVMFPHSDGETGTELVFHTPEAVYDFAQDLLRGYDELVGIGPPPSPIKHL
jgi:hypothetical protein